MHGANPSLDPRGGYKNTDLTATILVTMDQGLAGDPNQSN